MKENTTEYVILGILSNRSRTGYDIHKIVKTRMGSFWDIGYSQIYPTLKTLEKERLITKRVEINERGPNRKVYSITSEGTRKLQEWLLLPAKAETFRFEALLKILFGDQAPKEATIKHLEELKARNLAQLENILAVEDEIKAHLDENERFFFGLLTIMLGKGLHKSSVEWADTAIRMVKER